MKYISTAAFKAQTKLMMEWKYVQKLEPLTIMQWAFITDSV